MDESVWRHGALVMTWKKDGFGTPDTALYLGLIWLGEITNFGSSGRNGNPWRAWIATDDDGNLVDWYPTQEAAQSALVEAAVKALLGDGK